MMGRLTPSARQTLPETMARLNRKRRPPSVMVPATSSPTEMRCPSYLRRGRKQYGSATGFFCGCSPDSSRHFGFVVGHALVIQQLLQLALLEHLADDIAAAHELA